MDEVDVYARELDRVRLRAMLAAERLSAAPQSDVIGRLAAELVGPALPRIHPGPQPRHHHEQSIRRGESVQEEVARQAHDRVFISLVPRARQVLRERSSALAISPRDLRIVEQTRAKLVDARIDFGDALRALHEAVAEEIVDGRLFFLGHAQHGPMIGSIVSGVGIVDHPAGVQLLRAKPGGAFTLLGKLQR